VTIHIETTGKLGIVTGHIGANAIISASPAWAIRDDDNPIGAFICSDEARGETVTARIVELLERHGLADVPDHLDDEHG
jgi:hypothetical protein